MVEEAPNGATADQRFRSRKEVETFEGSKNHHLEEFDQTCPIDPQMSRQTDLRRSQSLSRDSRKHMRQSLKVLPFKPQLQPLLTAVQKANRGKFCRERKSWGIEEWRRVLFSDESRSSCTTHQIVKTIKGHVFYCDSSRGA